MYYVRSILRQKEYPLLRTKKEYTVRERASSFFSRLSAPEAIRLKLVMGRVAPIKKSKGVFFNKILHGSKNLIKYHTLNLTSKIFKQSYENFPSWVLRKPHPSLGFTYLAILLLARSTLFLGCEDTCQS